MEPPRSPDCSARQNGPVQHSGGLCSQDVTIAGNLFSGNTTLGHRGHQRQAEQTQLTKVAGMTHNGCPGDPSVHTNRRGQHLRAEHRGSPPAM